MVFNLIAIYFSHFFINSDVPFDLCCFIGRTLNELEPIKTLFFLFILVACHVKNLFRPQIYMTFQSCFTFTIKYFSARFSNFDRRYFTNLKNKISLRQRLMEIRSKQESEQDKFYDNFWTLRKDNRYQKLCITAKKTQRIIYILAIKYIPRIVSVFSKMIAKFSTFATI